ncbi:MAG TPA: T9SS type A sorting domain-containing protein [Flavobacteriales bacterium]
MRNLILIAAAVFTFPAAAQSLNDGVGTNGFPAGGWTNGLYEQTNRDTGRMLVYPNPASDRVQIAFPGLTGSAVISIIASDGSVVRMDQLNQTAGTLEIEDLSDLPDGVYIVSAELGNDRETTRLVLAR